MEGGFEQKDPAITAEAIKEQRGKNLEIYSNEVERLKKAAAVLKQRLLSLGDEIKRTYAEAWEDIKRRKSTLEAEQGALNKLIDENKALNRRLRQEIQEADEREAKAEAKLKNLAQQKDRFIIWKNQEENHLNRRTSELNTKEDNLNAANQKLDQKNFVIENRNTKSRERERLLEEGRDRLKESRKELASERQVMESDRRFSKEALATAKRIREEGWKIKEDAEALLAKAQEKMAEALKREGVSKDTSALLKQQKIAQDEKAKELQDWEDALKAEKVKLNKRREILKKKG